MASKLKSTVRAHATDPSVSGLVIETELQPMTGRGGVVAPPTYAREENDQSKAPRHAVSHDVFVPASTSDGWYSDIARNDDGTPRLADRVLLDSVGSQSGRAETCLWQQQERLGVALPGIVIGGEDPKASSATTAEEADLAERQLADALSVQVSTWEAAHRQSDAWARFAEAPGDSKQQVWQQDGPDSVKAILTSASAQNAPLLYRYFPNSAIYGFWLSSGVAARHRLPRAYSSEIVGYGAHAVATAATKLDPTGGASNTSKTRLQDKALIVDAKKGGKPSSFGLGQVPRPVVVRGYVCELILQQSSLSLSVLRSLRFDSDEQREAALTVLTLLAMTGHALAREDGFLRSGCVLVPESERWGWKRQYGGPSPEPLEPPTIDELAEALREAVSDAEQAGLAFEAPIHLSFSEAQRQLIKERVTTEASKAADPESE